MVTPRHLSDYLSELIDGTLTDLHACQCLEVGDNDLDVSPLPLGKIASYYYVACTSVEIMASSLSAKTKVKGLLEILSAATEFDSLPIRHGEDASLRNMAKHAVLSLPAPTTGGTDGGGAPSAASLSKLYTDVRTKANLLLQAHFSRRALPTPELRSDQQRVVVDACSLLPAMVDVVASEGWLKPALAAMELSQMVVQGLWADRDSVLLQVPHISRDMAAVLEAGGEVRIGGGEGEGEEDGDEGMGSGKGKGGGGASGSPVAGVVPFDPIESVFDLIALEDDHRAALLGHHLGLSPAQQADIARFCNRYPHIDVAYALPGGASGGTGEMLPFTVTLTREAGTEGMDEGAGIGAVYAPTFPKAKSEGWWLVVGDTATQSILSLRRVTLAVTSTVKLDFPLPAEPGAHELTLYFMCDSYVGCDQEYKFTVEVKPEGASGSGEGDDEAL